MKRSHSNISKLDFCIATEQKRYTALNEAFSEAKNRRLLLLSAEFTIFAFLFSNLQNLVPQELYGIIFFSLGVTSGVASLVLSFYHCRPISWPDPIGPVEETKISMMKNERKWKSVVLKDYRSANADCKKILALHAKTLKWSLILFVISITILLIIKFF